MAEEERAKRTNCGLSGAETLNVVVFFATVPPIFATLIVYTYLHLYISGPSWSKEGPDGFVIDLLIGATVAAMSKTAVAPVERAMLLIQNQDRLMSSGRLSEPYKGIVDCLRCTVRDDEGILGLWRGNLANILRYSPTQALNFALYDHFARTLMFIMKKEKDGFGKGGFAGNLVCGGAAGVCSLFFVYSLNYARTLLANDMRLAATKGGARQFSGILDVYRKTLAADGITGLYRGFSISCLGIFVYRAIYFGMYRSLKPVVLPAGSLGRNNFLENFLLGWCVTITGGFASYPIDTVRRRMMITSGEAVKYKSSLHAFCQILQKEGAKSFFEGASGHLCLRAMGGAGTLAGYDEFQAVLFGQS